MKTSNALTSHSTANILQIDWIVQFFAESEESDYHLFSEPQDILKWAQSLHPIFFFYSSSSMLPSNKTVAMPACYSKRKPSGSSDWSNVLELTLISGAACKSCFFSFTWHGVKLKDEVRLEKKRAHPMVIHVHLARLRRKTNGKVVLEWKNPFCVNVTGYFVTGLLDYRKKINQDYSVNTEIMII